MKQPSALYWLVPLVAVLALITLIVTHWNRSQGDPRRRAGAHTPSHARGRRERQRVQEMLIIEGG